MSASINQEITIRPQRLTQSAFAPFGHVIESPLGPNLDALPTNVDSLPPSFNPANQNTAVKGTSVSPWIDNYTQSKSQKAGNPTVSLFSCFPRMLNSSCFHVRILERHPYTTQTFIPMGVSPKDTTTFYLVIVAPTLPATEGFPDMGPPDLEKLEAFVAHGRQAVTYGAATWHAPMVVVGRKRVDFVVVQSTNGVSEDDCQEVEIGGDGWVKVEIGREVGGRGSKL